MSPDSIGHRGLSPRPAIFTSSTPTGDLGHRDAAFLQCHRFCQQRVVDLPRAPKFEPLTRMAVMPSRRFSSMMSVLLRMTDARLGASRPGAGHSARLSAPNQLQELKVLANQMHRPARDGPNPSRSPGGMEEGLEAPQCCRLRILSVAQTPRYLQPTSVKVRARHTQSLGLGARRVPCHPCVIAARAPRPAPTSKAQSWPPDVPAFGPGSSQISQVRKSLHRGVRMGHLEHRRLQ